MVQHTIYSQFLAHKYDKKNTHIMGLVSFANNSLAFFSKKVLENGLNQ